MQCDVSPRDSVMIASEEKIICIAKFFCTSAGNHTVNNLVLAVIFVCDFIGNLSYRIIYRSFVDIFVNLRLITSITLEIFVVLNISYTILCLF